MYVSSLISQSNLQMSLLQEHLHLDEVTGAITITDSRLFDREAQEGE